MYIYFLYIYIYINRYIYMYNEFDLASQRSSRDLSPIGFSLEIEDTKIFVFLIIHVFSRSFFHFFQNIHTYIFCNVLLVIRKNFAMMRMRSYLPLYSKYIHRNVRNDQSYIHTHVTFLNIFQQITRICYVRSSTQEYSKNRLRVERKR